MNQNDRAFVKSHFLQLSTDVAIIKTQLANHLHHHEIAAAKLNKWLIAITTMLGGIIGKAVLEWLW